MRVTAGARRERVQGEELVRDVRRRDGGRLAGPVVRRAHLDDVVAREAQTAKRAQEAERLTSRQAAGLRGAGARRERGVEHVDVEGEEERSIADPLPHARRVLLGTECDELVARDDLEAEVGRHGDVLGAIERAAHAGEERASRIDQALFHRSAEGGPVVVALADVHVPHVRVRVEQDEAERAVHRCVRAELAEDDAVVSAEAERPRACPDDRLEALRNLRRRPFAVARRHRDVTEIGDGQPSEDLRVLRGVVRAKRDRRGADRLGPEPRAGAIRRPRVEGDSENGDVDVLGALDERAAPERLDARVARRRQRVGRRVAGSVLSRHAATVPASVERGCAGRQTSA